MPSDLSSNCIYTIRHSKFLTESVASGGHGEFDENRGWAKGLELLKHARAADEFVPILFAPAEDVSVGVIYWAILEDLSVRAGKTTVQFSKLARLGRKIPLNQLIKLSDDEPLSDNHIHPYVPCHTPECLSSKSVSKGLPDKLPHAKIVQALALIDQGIEHHFAPSTAYDVVWEGRSYPPKAAIGVAAKLVTGLDYYPRDFSGGVGSKCFRLLLEAGFDIVTKGNEPTYPDEVGPQESFSEGSVTTVKVNRYERSPEARKKCISHYGSVCSVCKADFGKKYGNIGEGFIHVHHLKAISEIKKDYKVNPIKDLRPVCPNCHAMLHRKTPAFTLEELMSRIEPR